MSKTLLIGMRRRCAWLVVAAAGLVSPCVLAQTSSTTETLVFVRHGEKPAVVDNGQLTCQGFNRSLALAPVLLARYGTPNYLFAAAPVKDKDDNNVDYYYLRALATLEPTAVAAGQTINLDYDKDQIDDIEKELMKPAYQSALVFVAWEHTLLDELVVNIVHDNGGDASVVPAWSDDDYDSIFVVTLVRDGGQTLTTFAHDEEGLDGQSTTCPGGDPGQLRPPMPQPPIRPASTSDLSHALSVTYRQRASS